MKKLEELHTTRNLTGTKIRTEQNYSAKVQKIANEWFHVCKIPENMETSYTIEKTNWW